MADKKHISLLRLQQVIRSRIEDAMPLSCWVTAEISEMKVNYSGHCYLELVEKGGDNQVPRAKARAVIWRSAYGPVSGCFRSATGRDLCEGMQVLMKVSVSYHELYGLSLVVSDIDPLYTLGDMERQRQLTIQKLVDEGIFDMNRSLEIPFPAQRIAVVSSRNAAGYQDFMNELHSSPYRFDVALYDSFMQGHETEGSVVDALEAIASSDEQYDAVVMIRGGGSQSDLAAFDSYRLCCHIAQFPIPVITGIGHDKDESIADMVAAAAFKTPTAVAGYLVSLAAEFERDLEEMCGELMRSAVTVLEMERRRIREFANALGRTTTAMTRNMELRLERLRGEIERRYAMQLNGKSAVLARLREILSEKAMAVLRSQALRLDTAARITAGRTPEHILSLGFAIVRAGGRAVRSAGEVCLGQELDITLAKGSIKAKVKE